MCAGVPTGLDQLLALHDDVRYGRADVLLADLYRAHTCVPPEHLAPLLEALGQRLGPFMDDRGHLGFGDMTVHLESFALNLVRTAVFVGAPATVQELTHWMAGASDEEAWMMTLDGVSVDKIIQIGPRTSLKSLPALPDLWAYVPESLMRDRPRHLFGSIPKVNAHSLDGMAVWCRAGDPTVARPLLWNPDSPPPSKAELLLTQSDAETETRSPDPSSHLLDALSLITNRLVQGVHGWGCSARPATRVFTGLPEDTWWFEFDRPRYSSSPIRLNEELAARLKDILGKLAAMRDEQKDHPVGRALHRWMSSLRSTQPVDQLLDMRIALEAIYAPASQSESTLRVAYHGAKHLGKDLSARQTYFTTLKSIYNEASHVAHGRTPKDGEKTASLAKSAQNVCRDAILRILDDGEVPDWTALMLA